MLTEMKIYFRYFWKRTKIMLFVTENNYCSNKDSSMKHTEIAISVLSGAGWQIISKLLPSRFFPLSIYTLQVFLGGITGDESNKMSDLYFSPIDGTHYTKSICVRVNMCGDIELLAKET